jgi:predicted nucleic acid-binding protein
MPARSFFDTHVLIYADDKADPAKQQRALDLVVEHRRGRTGVVSLHVLQEYFVTVTRQLQVETRALRAAKSNCSPSSTSPLPKSQTFSPRSTCTVFTGFRFWDALIFRAAKQTGCSVLFSEDMQDREIDGLQIVNPFG